MHLAHVTDASNSLAPRAGRWRNGTPPTSWTPTMFRPSPLTRLPSLDLLRGFVAVGRRMSITLAADELCLSQSAVSRQVRALEERLGVALLIRRHRGVVFTPAGERLFRIADTALRQLQDVVAEIGNAGSPQPVTVSASIGVTGLWLLPRLGRLKSLHPGIDVRLSADNRIVELPGDGIDLAIRYCRDAMVPPAAIALFGETIAPIAHPSLRADLAQARETLDRVPLLEFDDPRPWLQWRSWLGDEDWRLASRRGILRFNQYDQVIHAALAGQGLALGRLELVLPLLDQGQLERVPSPLAVHSPNRYWLLQAEEQPRREVAEVASWIRKEAGAQSRRSAS